MSVEQCARLGIEVLTLFAFSSENWQRPKQEVSLLMELFVTALHREVRKLNSNDVRLRVVGDRSPFPEKLRNRIAEAEALTKGNQGLVLQIAANYGGRWDLAQAARRLAVRVLAGDLRPEAIDEAALASELSFADLPDPDLFIRTGGERRISNFLLWQAAYAELYFSDCLWPDFDQPELGRALVDFSQRQRRFGKTGDQVRQPPAVDPDADTA
jgi:undecaprenyl diphosphate synthase